MRDIAIALAIAFAGALISSSLGSGEPPRLYSFQVADGFVYVQDQRTGRVVQCARPPEAPAPSCSEVGRIAP